MVSSSRTCMMSPIHSPWALRWLPAWQLCVVVWEASVHLYHSEYKSCLLLTSRRWPSLLLQVQPLHRYNDILCLEEYTVFFWYKVNYKNAVIITVTHSAECCMFIWSQVWILSGPRVLFFLMWLMRVSWMPVQGIYWDIAKTSEQVMWWSSLI